MPDHPKIIDLCERGDVGLAAAFVWCCSLAYAGKHGTDGRITKSVLPRINGKAKHAQLLVAYRLWDAETYGWRIHSYEEYQMLAAAEADMRQTASRGGRTAAANMTDAERSARAKRAAEARWANDA